MEVLDANINEFKSFKNLLKFSFFVWCKSFVCAIFDVRVVTEPLIMYLLILTVNYSTVIGNSSIVVNLNTTFSQVRLLLNCHSLIEDTFKKQC